MARLLGLPRQPAGVQKKKRVRMNTNPYPPLPPLVATPTHPLRRGRGVKGSLTNAREKGDKLRLTGAHTHIYALITPVMSIARAACMSQTN